MFLRVRVRLRVSVRGCARPCASVLACVAARVRVRVRVAVLFFSAVTLARSPSRIRVQRVSPAGGRTGRATAT